MRPSGLSDRLHAAIPGGAHTYSRGDDQYPSNAPPLLVRGKGAYVWGPDGRRLLDYGMALRAVTLGYAHPRVNRAAWKAIQLGNNLTRPSLVELEAAEALKGLIPCAEMVKFAKNGSTVTTAAVKLARAYTGREMVAVCAEHPFFSYDDWFIGSTVMGRGVPKAVSRATLKFKFNDAASLEKLFREHRGRIAAVMFEPASSVEPAPGFLKRAQALCRRHGAVFILDEMITGFRWHLRGAQALYGVTPDLATFGKGMANGFSVAALVGKRDIMELGGIRKEGAERVFLISTTHGAEMCGLAAFRETLAVYREEKVVQSLWSYGRKLVAGLNAVAKDAGVADSFSASGAPCSPYYATLGRDGAPSPALRTLFSQEMIRGGVLMPWIALSLAHGDRELDRTLTAARRALRVYARGLEDGPEKHLEGPAVRPVFRRFN